MSSLLLLPSAAALIAYGATVCARAVVGGCAGLTLVPFQRVRTAHTALVTAAKEVQPEEQSMFTSATRGGHNLQPCSTRSRARKLMRICIRTHKLSVEDTVSVDSCACLRVYVHSRIFLPLRGPICQDGLRDAPRVCRHFVTCAHVLLPKKLGRTARATVLRVSSPG